MLECFLSHMSLFTFPKHVLGLFAWHFDEGVSHGHPHFGPIFPFPMRLGALVQGTQCLSGLVALSVQINDFLRNHMKTNVFKNFSHFPTCKFLSH